MSSFDVPIWAWALLGVLLIASITIDLIAHRHHHADSRRVAIAWTAVWISVALAFGGFIALEFGAEAGEQFLAAYLLEKALSLDNLFLFIVIFASLGIPRSEHHRVLTWGILGALVTRAIFIFVGAAALHRWHFLTYGLGVLLLVTAIKVLRHKETAQMPKPARWIQKHLKVSHFALAIIIIESMDILFAVDSIPAAFAVSEDRFILYSSNVLAVLGLRALYIVLADALKGLEYLHFGLAAILAFAGVKMLIAGWVKFPPLMSVAIIVSILAIAAIASVRARGRRAIASASQET